MFQTERFLMSWFLLLLAGLCEIGFAIGLKSSNGFTKPLPALAACTSMGLSLWLLALAVRQLPIGTAYAVWTGIGAIGTAIVGMLLLGEPRHTARIVCLLLIGAGLIGLKIIGDKPTSQIERAE